MSRWPKLLKGHGKITDWSVSVCCDEDACLVRLCGEAGQTSRATYLVVVLVATLGGCVCFVCFVLEEEEKGYFVAPTQTVLWWHCPLHEMINGLSKLGRVVFK